MIQVQCAQVFAFLLHIWFILFLVVVSEFRFFLKIQVCILELALDYMVAVLVLVLVLCCTWPISACNVRVTTCTKQLIAIDLHCESKNPIPEVFRSLFPNGWKFLVQILRTYYTFPSTQDYKFFIQLAATWTKLCHIKRNHPVHSSKCPVHHWPKRMLDDSRCISKLQ